MLLQHRKPLFPGTTCFPLSADSVMTFSSMHDQLNVIFDVIGTPSHEDIMALENDAARKYLLKLPAKPSKYVCVYVRTLCCEYVLLCLCMFFCVAHAQL